MTSLVTWIVCMDSSFYDSLHSLDKCYGGRFVEQVSNEFNLAKNIVKYVGN